MTGVASCWRDALRAGESLSTSEHESVVVSVQLVLQCDYADSPISSSPSFQSSDWGGVQYNVSKCRSHPRGIQDSSPSLVSSSEAAA
jgi:hypothetical protein